LARKRAVLLGAGHAHLPILRRAAVFAERGHELVVVAPDDFWYSGLATGMLGGFYPPELDRIDIGALVARAGARFVRDAAVGIDQAGRTVRLASGRQLEWDVLSLDLGSAPPPIAGAGEGTYGVKPISDLWQLRRDLEACFRRGGSPRVVIAGGGVTAGELAANIAALARSFDARLELGLLAAGDRPLGQLPEGARRVALGLLERRGVRLRTGARVVRLESGRAVTAGGESEPFEVFVNATGLRPDPLLQASGLAVDEDGALIVDEHLRSIAAPGVFGGGDGIALQGRPLAKIGVHAIRQAPILHANLLATLAGTGGLRRFEPQQRYLWIMNLGEGTGLAVRGSWWWHGRSAWLLKDWIDRRFLARHRVV
jgi:NADH dehydrogenase FAD-containing subunit